MLDLQKATLYLGTRILGQAPLTPLKLAALPSLIADSHGLYQLAEHLIRSLVDEQVADPALSPLVVQFQEQHPVVRQFYFQCGTIPLVAAALAVPQLPEAAPSFSASAAQGDMPKKKKKKAPAPQLALPAPQAAPAPALPWPEPAPAPAFASYAPSWPAIAPAPAPSPFASNPFASNPGYAAPAPAPAFDWSPPPPSAEEEALRARVRQLEAEVKALEAKLRDREAQILELKTLLSDRDQGLASVRAQMEQRLQAQQREQQQATEHMRAGLEAQLKAHAAEKQRLVEEQLGFSRTLLGGHLLRFDSAQEQGNRGASSDEVLKALAEMEAAYVKLLEGVEQEKDVVLRARLLADGTQRLLDNAKGLVSRLPAEHADLALQLTEGVRALATDAQSLLTHAQQLAPEGAPDEAQRSFLRGEEATMHAHALQVRQALTDSLRKLQAAPQVDLDGLAERELLNAARVIEDAASTLRQAGQQRKVTLGEGELDVEGALMEAALAITTATQLLVTSAAEAQQERVRKGLLSGDKWHRDPMWTEGLISAAKGPPSPSLLTPLNPPSRGRVDASARAGGGQDAEGRAGRCRARGRLACRGGRDGATRHGHARQVRAWLSRAAVARPRRAGRDARHAHAARGVPQPAHAGGAGHVAEERHVCAVGQGRDRPADGDPAPREEPRPRAEEALLHAQGQVRRGARGRRPRLAPQRAARGAPRPRPRALARH